MKKLLLALLLLPFLATGQPYAPQRQGTQRTTNQYAGSMIDSVLLLPYRDTTNWANLSSGDSLRRRRITMRPQDKKLYYHNGTKWLLLGTSGTLPDSAVINYGQNGPVVIGTVNNTDLSFLVNNEYAGEVSGSITSLGKGVLADNTGSSLLAIGQGAAAGNTASGITAVGPGAMTDNTGDESVAVGYTAGADNTGDQLTAVGLAAANGNTGSLVTAVGFNAGLNNTGTSTTAVGNGAGSGNTGTALTAIGDGAGLNNTQNNATLLGAYTKTTRRNSTAVGYRAYVTDSNALVLGAVAGANGATTSVKVGIGVTTPLDPLHLVGDFRLVGAFKPGGSAGVGGQFLISAGVGGSPVWGDFPQLPVFINEAAAELSGLTAPKLFVDLTGIVHQIQP